MDSCQLVSLLQRVRQTAAAWQRTMSHARTSAALMPASFAIAQEHDLAQAKIILDDEALKEQ
jgi:hypothetical protein